METIVELQREFFVNDDDETLLVPMVLKDVAERAHVDISTVSRAINSKYVETDYGVYSLRHFFSTQFTSADGETVAARQVKAALAEIVENEDKRAHSRRSHRRGLGRARIEGGAPHGFEV